MIKAVVFDIDDTLYDQQAPFFQALEQTFPKIAPKLSQHEVYILFRYHSDEVFTKYTSGEWTLKFMRIYRIQATMKDLGYPISEQQANEFQANYEFSLLHIVVQADLIEVLDRLKVQKIPLAVITNGPAAHQTKKVQQLGLAHWIQPEYTIISGAVGCEKPDAAIFHLVADKLNIPGEEILYIGDSYENDVIGAKNAGWQVLWLDHRKRLAIENISEKPDWQLDDFKALPEFLHTLITKNS